MVAPDRSDQEACVARDIAEGDVLSIPTRSDRGWRSVLARSNSLRQLDARARLQSLGEIGSYLDQTPSVGEHGAPLAVGHWASASELWHAIETLCSTDDLRPGRFIMGEDAIAAPEDAFSLPIVDIDTAYAFHRPNVGAAGQSVVLLGVDAHVTRLQRLLADCESVGGRPCSAGVILLPNGAVHTEPADRASEVLLTPVVGAVAVVDTPAQGISLGFGTVARLGRSLSIRATGDLALVLRLVLPIHNPVGDLRAAARLARFHPLMRADAPASYEHPVTSYAGSIFGSDVLWDQEIGSVLGPTGREHAAALLRARVPNRTTQSTGLLELLDVLSRDHWMRCPAQCGVMTLRDTADSALAFGNRILTLNVDAAAVAPFLDGRTFRKSVLGEELGNSEFGGVCADDTIRDLLVHQIFEAVPDPVGQVQ